MIYGSVCSGIEAASVAWHALGWKCAFVSEIEPFPRAVLKHRWPEHPLHGDFTTIEAGQYGPIDILVGGTPCQSFSVAGLRGGLADDRGNLALQFLLLAQRLRPRWVVWENVPGVLSSWSDAEEGDPPAGHGALLREDGLDPGDFVEVEQSSDFDTFTGGLSELGYGWAWRVLDAQYFGVAQRRRRVFLVGCLGDRARAAAVLFERHSLSGHPPPRRTPGKGPTSYARSGLGSYRDGVGPLQAAGGDCGDGSESLTVFEIQGGDAGESDLSPTLDTRCKDGPRRNQAGTLIAEPSQEVSPSLLVGPGSGYRVDSETEAFVSEVAPTLGKESCSPTKASSGQQMDFCIMDVHAPEVASCLGADPSVNGRDAEQGDSLIVAPRPGVDVYNAALTGEVSQTVMGEAGPHGIPHVIDMCGGKGQANVSEDISPSLGTSDGHAVAFEARIGRNDRGGPSDVVPPLKAESGQGDTAPLVALEGPQAFEARIARTGSGQPSDVVPCLSAEGDGDSRPLVAIPPSSFNWQSGVGVNVTEEQADTLLANQTPAVFQGSVNPTGHQGDVFVSTDGPANCIPAEGGNLGGGPAQLIAAEISGPLHTALNTSGGDGNDDRVVLGGMAVRRLTPTECERLQGFPDGYTLIPFRGKTVGDGPRYRALGNSMAVPVMAWIGRRIQKVNGLVDQFGRPLPWSDSREVA